MTKREKPLPCPLCLGRAHMGEVTNAKKGVTRYHVVCDDERRPMFELPYWFECFETEQEAVDAWNGVER